jgi:hypothetical protein
MGKDELIVKQQLEIEQYKTMLQENAAIRKALIARFYGIGAPLNDNVLQFNREQQKWCFQVAQLVDEINVLPKED